MKKHQKLSDILFNKPPKVLVIKNREKLLSIYDEYLQGHFITVVNLITAYGDFDFFRDLLIHMNGKYRSESYRTGIYSHFNYLYFEEFRI
jgi:hypothetical protein